MNTFIPPRSTLLCPGPVNVIDRVASAYCHCALSHREEAFTCLLREVQRDMLHVAGVADIEHASALMITGSGTAANEAVLASAVMPDSVVIVLANGEFGERLAKISSVYNRTILLRVEWGEELDLTALERRLAEQPAAMVAMVHHETSTGLLNPVREVGQLCRRYGAKFFVDAVSSFAADPLNMEDCGITFLTTSSGKALAGYPGLSFVLGNNEQFGQLADYPVRNHYLHLPRYYEASLNDGQTPNTPAVSLVATLHQSLREILREGLDAHYARLQQLSAYLRSELAARDLYRPAGRPQSVILTNVRLPETMSFGDLQQGLKEKGFVIYDAKGPLRGRFFQVSIIGDIGKADIDRFFAALDGLIEKADRCRPTALQAV